MTEKNKFFLKLGMFGMIAGTLLLAFGVVKVNAISYYGTSTRQYPDSYSGTVVKETYPYWGFGTGCAEIGGGWGFGEGGGINQRAPSYCNLQNGIYSYATIFDVLEFDVEQYIGVEGAYTIWGYGSIFDASARAIEAYFYTDHWTINSHVWDVDGTQSNEVIFSLPNTITSGGFYPHRFALVDSHEIMRIWTGSETGKEYLHYGYNALYSNSGTVYLSASVYYSGTFDNRGILWGNMYNYHQNSFNDFSGATATRYTSSMYNFLTEGQQTKFIEFAVGGLTSTGVNYISGTLPELFGATKSSNSSIIGATGTGTDYFASCGNFLDVGCYIQGFWNGVSDTVSGWFNYIFPSVSWTAAYTTGCNSSGSTYTGSNLTGSGIGYLDKLKTFLLVVIPIPPPEGTEYCLIGGFTGTVAYQGFVPDGYKNQMPGFGSMLDVMFLILMGYIMIATIMRHGGTKVNTEGNHWHSPSEDVGNKNDTFHKVESFIFKAK